MKTKIMNYLNEHECLKRTIKTFVQTACGTLIVSLTSGEYNIAEWRTWITTVLVSSVSAGFAAIMNINKKG